MTHTRKNQGVCSRQTTVELDENGVITKLEVTDGCDGNLKGISALAKGRSAAEVIPIIENITCGGKSNSCPMQISLCLREALEKQQA